MTPWKVILIFVLLLFQHPRHFRISHQLDKVVKIVHPSDLTRNCNTFTIMGTDLAIILHWFKCIFRIPFLLSFTLLRFLMRSKHQIAAYHNTCSPFSSLAMYSHTIPWMLIQESITVFTEFKDHIKWRWVVVIKSKIFAYCSLVKIILVIFSFGTQIINTIMISMFCIQEVFDLSDWVTDPCFFSFRWISHCNDVLRDIAQV